MGLLELLIVLLIVIWVAGMGTAYTMGGALHLLLIVVVVLVLVRLARGQPL
jgi:hypothetical protein